MNESAIFMTLLIFLAITGLISSDHGTCRAALYRRKSCGYRGISKVKCESRGCCFQRKGSATFPNCYRKVSDNVVDVCPTAVTGRKPCGYRGINPYQCKLRGCCFEANNNPKVPACHIPVLLPIIPEETTTQAPSPKPVQRGAANTETSTVVNNEGGRVLKNDSLATVMRMFRHMGDWQNATKSCAVSYANRKNCGYHGITKGMCLSKDCCWDTSSSKSDVSWCYYPLWIFPERTVINGDGKRIEETSTNLTHSNQNFFYNSKMTTTMVLPPADVDDVKAANGTPPYHDENVDPPQKDSLPTAQTFHTTLLLPVTSSATKLNHAGLNTVHLYSFLQYYSFYKDKLRSRSSCSANSGSCCQLRPSSPCCEYESASVPSQAGQRIVGGSPAGFLKTSIAYLTTANYASQICGGTIVNRRWIATAAHCLLEYCNGAKDARHLIIKLGKTEKSNFLKGDNEQRFTAAKVVCHPHNCKNVNQPRLNDIALVKLSRPAHFNYHVNIASLPAQGEVPMKGQGCVVLGWGETRGHSPKNVLKQVRVPSYSNEQCNRPDWRSCMVRACMMCAGDLNKDACDGDSGGPLFCLRSDGHYVLHGIYSWGRCGAAEKKPAVYTRFSYYVSWIQNVIRSDRIR